MFYKILSRLSISGLLGVYTRHLCMLNSFARTFSDMSENCSVNMYADRLPSVQKQYQSSLKLHYFHSSSLFSDFPVFWIHFQSSFLLVWTQCWNDRQHRALNLMFLPSFRMSILHRLEYVIVCTAGGTDTSLLRQLIPSSYRLDLLHLPGGWSSSWSCCLLGPGSKLPFLETIVT